MCSSVVACAVKIHELFRLQNGYNCTTVQPVSMCALKTESIFIETTATDGKENNILECIKMILYNPKLLHV